MSGSRLCYQENPAVLDKIPHHSRLHTALRGRQICLCQPKCRNHLARCHRTGRLRRRSLLLGRILRRCFADDRFLRDCHCASPLILNLDFQNLDFEFGNRTSMSIVDLELWLLLEIYPSCLQASRF